MAKNAGLPRHHPPGVLGVPATRHPGRAVRYRRQGRYHSRTAFPQGEDGSLLDHLGELRAGQADGGTGNLVEGYVRRQRKARRLEAEQLETGVDVEILESDHQIEPAGTFERRVEKIGPVCRREKKRRPLVGCKAIPAHQELGEHRVVDAVAVLGTTAADGVDFVDEYDGRSARRGSLEPISTVRLGLAHPLGGEVGRGDGEEGQVGLASGRPGEQRLAVAGRTFKKDPGRRLELGAELTQRQLADPLKIERRQALKEDCVALGKP